MLGNYVTPVPAQMRRGPYWFLGSADAVYQNLNLIGDERPDHVCVFGADHIYRMDPRPMVEEHVASGAGVTVAAIPVPLEMSREFGVIEADGEGRIVRFHEKVDNPPPMPGDSTRCLASMGNYVFETQTLIDAVTPAGTDQRRTDIGGDVIPALTADGVARVYDFSTNDIPGQGEGERGYWRDVGTLDAYYETNMDLIAPVPVFNLYNNAWPVLTHQPPLPPAKVSRGGGGEPAAVDASLLCQGSIISGAQIERSIIGPGCYVDGGANVVDSILFPGVRVGPGAHLHRCVIDKNVVVPAGYRIGHDPAEDADRFTLSDAGIAVVAKGQRLEGASS
jgi:glucose-1-phosphate adenylyltransferase